MKITLSGIPPSLNRFAGRENTWQYREEKKHWTDAVMWMAKSAKGRPKQPFEKAVVMITYYFSDRRRHDADNYAGKFLLDGLTKAGIIVDDDLQHISTIIRGDYDRENPRTEISVEEAYSNGELFT